MDTRPHDARIQKYMFSAISHLSFIKTYLAEEDRVIFYNSEPRRCDCGSSGGCGGKSDDCCGWTAVGGGVQEWLGDTGGCLGVGGGG